MKKILSYIGCAFFTLVGLWLTFIAEISDDSPFDQGGLAILAALSFCVALLFAGYGNSLPPIWKDKE